MLVINNYQLKRKCMDATLMDQIIYRINVNDVLLVLRVLFWAARAQQE